MVLFQELCKHFEIFIFRATDANKKRSVFDASIREISGQLSHLQVGIVGDCHKHLDVVPEDLLPLICFVEVRLGGQEVHGVDRSVTFEKFMLICELPLNV